MIVAVTVTKRLHLLPDVAIRLANQKRPPDAWMIVVDPKVTSTKLPALPPSPPSSVSLGGSDTLGGLRNYAVYEAIKHWPYATVVASVDDDDWYGPGYFATLEDSIAKHPGAAIWGCQKYGLGHVVGDRLLADGSNVQSRYLPDGGQLLPRDRCTWVSGATVAINIVLWHRHESMRYSTKERVADGHRYQEEDGGLLDSVKALGLDIVTRPPTDFTAVRYHPVGETDGWGGEHGHTWGPLPWSPPSVAPPPPAELVGSLERAPSWDDTMRALPALLRSLTALADAVRPGQGEVGLQIAVRRKAVAEKVLPRFLWGWVREDPTLAVGLIRFEDAAGRPLRSIDLGEG